MSLKRLIKCSGDVVNYEIVINMKTKTHNIEIHQLEVQKDM